MLKKLFKILLGILVVLLALVAFVAMSLQARVPESTFELQPAAASQLDRQPVLLFGATRNTGLEVAKILRARGEPVTAAVRATSDRSALEAIEADIVVADAFDLEALRQAFASNDFRAVVSTIGCYSCDPAPDGIGNQNIIDAARAAGVKRMVLITTIGSGDSYDTVPWISRIALRGILPLKTQAEDHLRASGLDYTIIRPGGLPPKPASGRGYLSEDRKAFGFISRGDLARLIVGVLDDDRTINKTFAAADPEIKAPWD